LKIGIKFMVGKLMGYCTARQHYERGILYGSDILRCDVAHEPTYRRLMRLHALAGNRTGALRQYERCVTVLEQELGVQPTEPTVALYNQIRDGRSVASVMPEPPTHGQMPSSLSLTGLLERLTYVKMDLSRAQSQVEEDIELVKTALRGQG
jgi:DNA-binding SARP family transcriptional activator